MDRLASPHVAAPSRGPAPHGLIPPGAATWGSGTAATPKGKMRTRVRGSKDQGFDLERRAPMKLMRLLGGLLLR